MISLLRRLAPLTLAGLVLLSLAPAAHAADLSISAAEQREVDLLNEQRTALGLVPVRIDSRLMAVARGRSTDMARKDYFAHQQPDGKWAWDLMTAARITWYGAGEIIAWNTSPTLAESAVTASRQWRDSPGHYAVIKDTNFNYVGVGLAVDGAKKIWTAIFMKGPDRTGGWGRMGAATLGSTATIISATGARVGLRWVTYNWRGSDIRLSVLTAGFKDFQVQRRVSGGAWTTIVASTTRTSLTERLTRYTVHEIRVRARDRNGNYGAWSGPLAIRP